MSTSQNRVYHIVLFAFRGAKRAEDILADAEAAQRMAGYRILARAVVERDVQGEVHIHEPGRGGVGGTVGAIAGGLLGLFGGPLGVLVLAVAGGAVGGIAGHFAGRAIPEADLKKMGDALPLDSSGVVVLLEDTEAEQLISDMGGKAAQIVSISVGDELSGEIDTVVAAQMGDDLVNPAPVQPAPADQATPAGQKAGQPASAGQPAAPGTQESSVKTTA